MTWKCQVLLFLNQSNLDDFPFFFVFDLEYNHFEIVLADKFSDSEPPPGKNIVVILLFSNRSDILLAIALCTASPLDPPPVSQFKQDYLRFWPTGDGKSRWEIWDCFSFIVLLAAKYLKQGDKIGWGVLFPQEDEGLVGNTREQLIICYLTVNRTVGYVRVLYQPVGGLYPVVIAPPNGSSY